MNSALTVKNPDALMRRLGYIESLMCVMHESMNGTTQAVQLLQIAGMYDFALVVKAARLLFEQYELLQCNIKKIDNDYYFEKSVQFNQINIKQVVIDDENAWLSLFSSETNMPLTASSSLWRLLVIVGPAFDEYRILFTCHHAIIDNDGMYAIATKFLSYFDALLSNRTVVNKTGGEVPPPIDSFLRLSLENPILAPLYIGPAYTQRATVENRSTQCVHGHLDADEHHKLQMFCAKEKIKIHSLLGAALYKAAYKAGIVKSQIPFKTAVSLRVFPSLLRCKASQLGCYVSVAETPMTIQDKNILGLALEYEGALRNCIVKRCLTNVRFETASLKLAVDAQKENKHFVHGIGITNLGEVEVPVEFENFSLVNYIPIVNRVAGNFVFVLHAYSFRGVMNFSFVYADPLINKVKIERVRDLFVAQLSSLVSKNPQLV